MNSAKRCFTVPDLGSDRLTALHVLSIFCVWSPVSLLTNSKLWLTIPWIYQQSDKLCSRKNVLLYYGYQSRCCPIFHWYHKTPPTLSFNSSKYPYTINFPTFMVLPLTEFGFINLHYFTHPTYWLALNLYNSSTHLHQSTIVEHELMQHSHDKLLVTTPHPHIEIWVSALALNVILSSNYPFSCSLSYCTFCLCTSRPSHPLSNWHL